MKLLYSKASRDVTPSRFDQSITRSRGVQQQHLYLSETISVSSHFSLEMENRETFKISSHVRLFLALIHSLSLWAGRGCTLLRRGPGLKSDQRSHCLVGETRITFLTSSYLHATIRADRMREMFRSISPYNKNVIKTHPSAHHIDSMSRAPPLCLHVCVFMFFTGCCVPVTQRSLDRLLSLSLRQRSV